jgi:hypothetical protein
VAGLVITGALGAIVTESPAARADAGVHTIVDSAPIATAPYMSDQYASLGSSGENLTISCYVTGDSVSGPYGAENVWDEVTGGVSVPGDFVPDADLYTGSNSPVVPRCATALGRVIQGDPGSQWLTIEGDPYAVNAADGQLSVGQHVELKCYTAGRRMNGPYGSETIWDKITEAFGGNPEYVPDADIYTGSNSAAALTAAAEGPCPGAKGRRPGHGLRRER